MEALTESSRHQGSSLGRLRLRAAEWVTLGFFAYVAVISPWFPRRPLLKEQPVLLLLAVAGVFVLLARMERIPRFAAPISILRDWLPLATTLVAFKEMGLFQPLRFSHWYESNWIRWDDVVLQQWQWRSAIEALGPVVPSILETCYLLVYLAGAFGIAVLYLVRRRKRVDEFLSLYVLGTLLAYSLFPYFPSQPPRIAFPHVDAPQIMTTMRSLNLWVLENGTIHSSVFPSAHVSSAFSAAWAMFLVLPGRRAFGWGMLFYAVGVSVATVYGRYHYTADALAGFGISVLALGLFRVAHLFQDLASRRFRGKRYDRRS